MHGETPHGDEFLLLGEENLGRVLEAPPGSDILVGNLVVGSCAARPEPCPACAAGEWEMFRDGRIHRARIRGLHGVARERWRADPDAVVRVSAAPGRLGVLLDPRRSWPRLGSRRSRSGIARSDKPEVVAVTRAGPVVLLAALLVVQRGPHVQVLDHVTEGPMPDLVRAPGATYHHDMLPASGVQADVIIECSGAPQLVVDVATHSAPDATVCLTGVSDTGSPLPVDFSTLNREVVLDNKVVIDIGGVDA